MLVKINYDAETGEIKGFFPEDIVYESIPEPHIKVDEEIYHECLENAGKRRVDLKTLKIAEYMPPGPTLAELQIQAWNRIKTERDRLEQSGAPYLSKILDSDEKSVTRISIAVQAAQAAISAGTAFNLDWTMQDNSVVTMDAEQVVGMSVALAAHSNSIHQAARVARIAIDEAKSDKEVEAAEKTIVWPE